MTVLQRWHQWPEGFLLPVPHIGDLGRITRR
jgi:hypothetical protein